MDIKEFKNFLLRYSSYFTNEDIKFIINGEYDKLINILYERYTKEKSFIKRSRLKKIIKELYKFLQEMKNNSYKFSYEKSYKFEHFEYWFNLYIKEYKLNNAKKVLNDIKYNFSNNNKKIQNKIKKLENIYKKEKQKFYIYRKEITNHIEKENEIKKLENLINQGKPSEAMGIALKLIQKFPKDKEIKKYIKKIDKIKDNQEEVDEIENESFIEKQGLKKVLENSIKNNNKNNKEDIINDIIKKLKTLYKSSRFDEGLELIKYIQKQYNIYDKKIKKYHESFIKSKANYDRKKQMREYKTELNSAKLMFRNKQYDDALKKSNTILKKYFLIEKNEVINLISKIKDKINKENKNAKTSKISEWLENINMKIAKLNKKGVLIFYEKMSWLLKARIDLKSTLQIIISQTKDSGVKYFTKRLALGIESGMKISYIIKMEKVISDFDISMIKIGEQTGKLGEIFEKIHSNHQQAQSRKKKIRSMMIYPSIVIAVTILIFILILVFIIPKFVEFFKNAGVELPALTQFMLNLSNFIQNNYILIIIGLILFVILMIAFSKTTIGKYFFGYINLKLPIISNIVMKKYNINFCKNLSMLLKSGLPILDGLDLIVQSCENPYFADEYKRIRFEIESGMTLSKATGLGDVTKAVEYKNQFIPIEIAYTIDIGEKTGQLSSMLDNVGDIYDEDLRLYINNLQGLLEPFIIILVGLIVFIFVLTIFLPMLQMYEAVGKGGGGI